MARPAVRTKRATSPRGRPTAERVAAIDEAIRAAALEQFLALGYEAASMDAIAAAARVSKGTLYARFKGKEPLFRSIVIEQFQRLDLRASSQNHLLPTEFEPRLRHHARMLIQVFGWSEYRGIMKLVESATAAMPQTGDLWARIASTRYIRFLSHDMAETAKIPADAQVDWTFLANLFLHSIVGWYRAERAKGSDCEAEAIVFADQVCAAIATLAGRSATAE